MKLLLNRVDKNAKRQKRHLRARQYIFGTAERPRLAVFRSNNHMYAQIIDDTVGKTLVPWQTFTLRLLTMKLAKPLFLPALLKKIEKPATAAT